MVVSDIELFDVQVDLLDFIDWSGVECLNQSTSHSLVNALKQVFYSISGFLLSLLHLVSVFDLDNVLGYPERPFMCVYVSILAGMGVVLPIILFQNALKEQ